MIGEKTQNPEISVLDVLVPRALLASGNIAIQASVTDEGFCPLKIFLEKGRITNILPIKDPKKACLKILLPRFIEPHAHIDKAFTWGQFPNLEGTYSGALKANYAEHEVRTKNLVVERAKKSLKLAFNNGYRAIRTHIDSLGPGANQIWDALIDLQNEWRDLIQLEFVALVPLEYWSTNDGYILAEKVAKADGCLGGVLLPPFKVATVRKHLYELFRLSTRFKCGIDLHIDETSKCPAAGLKQLINALTVYKEQVNITCSHLSNLGLLNPKELRYFSQQLASYKVNVISLPLTNSWLLGRQGRNSSIERLVAPISQLQNEGVNVAIGGDNVQDPWFPGGNFDPISLMTIAMPITQLCPWYRLGIAPFTTAPARIMNLKWDGTIGVGSPADFVCLDASNWSEVLSSGVKRKIIFKGEFLENKSFFLDEKN